MAIKHWPFTFCGLGLGRTPIPRRVQVRPLLGEIFARFGTCVVWRFSPAIALLF
ncbi:hypothetical protein [Oscillatoria sp. HE19RPO]|uniref:hypothetical protein n=1 Tax=Oscillatoria sp. HE19RPO TaxID=2954806 RepID=UPI0020C3F1DE|nr:hypothetical protein [Oscillatoria sp. HE19RPO]